MSSTRLLACTTTPKSSIEGFMECYVLNSYVQIGDFLVVSTPTDSTVVGELINVSKLNDICVSEIDVEGEHYLFLDNGQDENKKICDLLQIWKPAEINRTGYTGFGVSST